MQRTETVLVLSGSGANITYELGAAAELQKHMNITTIYACSAGSIIGLVVALGISLEQYASDIVKIIGATSVNDGSLLSALQRLIRRGYMFKRDIRSRLLSVIFTTSSNRNKGVTFGQLDFDLNIVATRYLDCKRVTFNKHNTPNVVVVDAIMASSAIPLFCPSVFIEGVEYVDGIFTNDYAYNLANSDNSIGIYISVPSGGSGGGSGSGENGSGSGKSSNDSNDSNRRKTSGQRRGAGFGSSLRKFATLNRMSLSNVNNIPDQWLLKTIFCDIPEDNNNRLFTIITPDKFNRDYQFGSDQTKRFLATSSACEVVTT